MKIVCDACQAKYSISDDKVQGKVFKIRCKKCSNIIVVRGGASAAEAPAPTPAADTRVYDYGYDGAGGEAAGDDAVWHVVINQDQVGPMTAAEVQQRFAGGEIDGETYAWREGFADWLPLSQIENFAAFVASGSTTSASSGGGGAAAVSAMFGGGGNDESGTVRSDPGDLFASASSGASSSDDDGGDLFGSKPSKSSSSSAASAASSADKLRGERNENSVLFSLNNLAQLASDKPAPNAGVSSMPSGHASGAAGGEGSGLIDIRSMANAYLGGNAGSAKPASASAGIGSIDDLPVFGGGGFSEPAVIVPTAQRQSNSKMMYALIGSVGVLAVAAVILVIVLLKGGDKNNGNTTVAAKNTEVAKADEEKKPEGNGTGGDTKAEPPAEAKTGSDSVPGTEPVKADVPAEPPKEEPKETKEPAPKKDTKKDTKREPKATAVAKAEPKATAPTPAPTPKADAGGCDEVSCVLNNYEGACCAKHRKGGSKTTTAKPAGGGGDAPDSLDRAMISDGVNKVKAKVMACGDKSSAKGQVKVSVKVNPAGDVASVSVKNTPDPALGNCVAGAMGKAKFSKTQNGGSFGYPFVF